MLPNRRLHSELLEMRHRMVILSIFTCFGIEEHLKGRCSSPCPKSTLVVLVDNCAVFSLPSHCGLIFGLTFVRRPRQDINYTLLQLKLHCN